MAVILQDRRPAADAVGTTPDTPDARPAQLTALRAVGDSGRVRPGQLVLINGADGAVGRRAVAVASAMGAYVTAVCSHGAADDAHAMGAHRVIAAAQEDVRRSGHRYDLIVDLAGDRPVGELRGALTAYGRLVVVVGEGGGWVRRVVAVLLSPFVRHRLRAVRALSRGRSPKV